MPQRKTIYALKNSVLQETDLLNATIIPDPLRHFLKCYVQLCNESGQFFGLEVICHQLEVLSESQTKATPQAKSGYSKSRISQMMKILKEAQAMNASRVMLPPEKGFYNKIELTSLKNLIDHLNTTAKKPVKKEGRVSLVILKQAEEFIGAKNGNYLRLDSSSYNRIDQLFCILDSCMKSSSHDRRKNIQVDYFFSKHDFIKIEAVTTTGQDDDIANLADQRVMRVLNGHYANKIEEDREQHGVEDPDGYFTFDIHQLCTEIGLTPDIKNKNTVRAMINRLCATEFIIDATSSPYFKQAFGYDRGRYRYLTESKSISELESIDENHALYQVRERFYKVRLHGDIVKNITNNGKLFISNPKLARESIGLAHRINNWCKAVVGVGVLKERQHRYTFDDFHERVHPASNLPNFKRDFLKLVRREFDGVWGVGEGTEIRVNLHGFFFLLRWDSAAYTELTKKTKRRLKKNNKTEIVVEIARDPSDPWVGDDSDHNKKVRKGLFEKKQKEAEI